MVPDQEFDQSEQATYEEVLERSRKDYEHEVRTLMRAALNKQPAPKHVMRIVNKSGFPLEYATEGSIGLDLRAVMGMHRDVPAHGRFQFHTGISIELPGGLGATVKPRSGLALHHGVWAIDGSIDQDYRGELKVLLYNSSPEPYRVLPGDKIAQLVIFPVPRVAIEQVEELTMTGRGNRGFGSSGR
jgi:dUTP pyrophosphatase